MKIFRLLVVLLGVGAGLVFTAITSLQNGDRTAHNNFIVKVFGGASRVDILSGQYALGGVGAKVLFRIEAQDLAKAAQSNGLKEIENDNAQSVIRRIGEAKIADFYLSSPLVRVYRSTRRMDGVERVDLCYDPASKHAVAQVYSPAL